MQAMDQRSEGTREKLVEAARQLFAERGVEAVSLREITRAAGQANVNALQYHFGDRENLLMAVLDSHHREVEARRHALLDEIEARDTHDLRDLGVALVRPAAAMLQLEGGREYLRILGEMIRDPDRYGNKLVGFRSSLDRWRRLTRRHMPEAGTPLHRRFAAIHLAFGELARRAETSRRSDHRLFVSDLVDLATGLLAAPVSGETKRLLCERGSPSRLRRAAGGTRRA
jgi:AcrR family transcriptional regulator